ncbi:MAG: hypothetical protein ABJE66_31675 [Deltaproteobacteria bacterium]
MKDAWSLVLHKPRSIAARRELLEQWNREQDPRARLLGLALNGFLDVFGGLDVGGDGGEMLESAARLIYDKGKELAGPIASLVDAFDFQLGLVGGVLLPAKSFERIGKQLVALAPLVGLALDDPADSLGIATNPVLAQVLDLGFRGRGIDDDLAKSIASSDFMSEVRELDLSGGTITDVGFAALVASTKLPNLLSLDLTGNACERAGTEVDGRFYWIPPAADGYWNTAMKQQFLSSAYSPAQLVWPPIFDKYAWTD